MRKYYDVFKIGLFHSINWIKRGNNIALAAAIAIYWPFMIVYLTEKNDLDNNKVYTRGVMFRIRDIGGYKDNCFTYYVGNKEYTGWCRRAFDSMIKIGDSVIISYDRSNPKNYAVVGYFEYVLDRSKLPDSVYIRQLMNHKRQPIPLNN